MNWYIDNAGAAEGPYDDHTMTEMAQGRRIASDSLVWHAGLDAWASVAAISPAWWGAALPEPANTPRSRKKVIEQQPLPNSSTTTGSSVAQASTSATKRRLTAPNAPNDDGMADKESGGLLKKLFGFGKKKK